MTSKVTPIRSQKTRQPDVAPNSISIARTEHDLVRAFELVHYSYCTAGLAADSPSGLRLTPYHLSGHSDVLIAEIGDEWVVDRVVSKADRFKHPKIACLGLAYKPDIDDLRESPAVEIVREIQQRNIGELRIVEPNLESHEQFDLVSLDEGLDDADIVLFLVGHRSFLSIASAKLSEKVIIDICGAMTS